MAEQEVSVESHKPSRPSRLGSKTQLLVVSGVFFLVFFVILQWSVHNIPSNVRGLPKTAFDGSIKPAPRPHPHHGTGSFPDSPSQQPAAEDVVGMSGEPLLADPVTDTEDGEDSSTDLSAADDDAVEPSGADPWATDAEQMSNEADPEHDADDTEDTDEDTDEDTQVDAQVDEAVENQKHPALKPIPDGQSKAIVVASLKKENTAWFHTNFPDWDLNIYVVDDKHADLTISKNAGHEAAVYLTYIIKHYHDLPDYILFSHAQRYQWHNDDPMYDGVGPIKLLQLAHVREEGYVSLRCNWNPGCPTALKPSLTKPQGFFSSTKDYAKAFQQFFPEKNIPKAVGAPCCAQFAVTREQIRRRSLKEYKRYRRWLWHSGIFDGKSGRIFEYLWHHIFFKPIKYCPDAAGCYCKTFGLCHLKCPDKKHCLGRYSIPPFNQPMPKGWPHPKDHHGFVRDKWWEKFYPPKKWDGFEPRKKSSKSNQSKSGNSTRLWSMLRGLLDSWRF